MKGRRGRGSDAEGREKGGAEQMDRSHEDRGGAGPSNQSSSNQVRLWLRDKKDGIGEAEFPPA